VSRRDQAWSRLHQERQLAEYEGERAAASMRLGRDLDAFQAGKRAAYHAKEHLFAMQDILRSYL